MHKKVERLCRYIARPAISEKHLSLTSTGKVRYELKTPFRNGTTHVIFEPLDFIARLAALVPKSRVNLTRFHGVFAPNSKHRALVTPSGRGKGSRKSKDQVHADDKTPAERHTVMSWPLPHLPVLRGTCTSCSMAAPAHPCASRHLHILFNGRSRTSLCFAAPAHPVQWPLPHLPVLRGTCTSCSMGTATEAGVQHRHRNL